MPQNKKGFTLIELLIVIVIIGILAGILISSMVGATNSANDARRKADLNQVAKTLMLYGVSSSNYPQSSTLCDIGNTCPAELNTILGGLSNIKDPNNTYYTYWSDGNSFIINSTLADTSKYSFNSSNSSYSSGTVNPACGTAAKTYYGSASSFGADTFCASGTLSTTPSFPTVGNNSSWGCGGTSIVSCSASKMASSCINGTGVTCTETLGGSYTINKYTANANTTSGTVTWTAPTGTTSIDILVIAGGGGGGGYGYSSGGGAGGFIERTSFTVTPGNTYDIKVGGGGLGGTASNAANGDDSEFGNPSSGGLRSLGGGRGSRAGVYAPSSGGSGGGGDHDTVGYNIGGSATQPSSSWGGYGNSGANSGNSYSSGGGGAGSTGFSGSQGVRGGNGGTGRQSAITSLYYAAGGGGGMPFELTGGTGGSSIGGNGGSNSVMATGGTPGTGSGGGGSGAIPSWVNNEGDGGSGVVIIKINQ